MRRWVRWRTRFPAPWWKARVSRGFRASKAAQRAGLTFSGRVMPKNGHIASFLPLWEALSKELEVDVLGH